MLDEMDVFTRSQAMRMVSDIVGFPNPSPHKLSWYFEIRHDGKFIPKVNFVSLAKELDEKSLVAKMGIVVHLPVGHADRQKIEDEIHAVIRKHDLDLKE